MRKRGRNKEGIRTKKNEKKVKEKDEKGEKIKSTHRINTKKQADAMATKLNNPHPPSFNYSNIPRIQKDIPQNASLLEHSTA